MGISQLTEPFEPFKPCICIGLRVLLPPILTYSYLFPYLVIGYIGSIVGIILMKKQGESRPFAFGPYIAIAGIIALLYGQDIVNWYLGMYA